MAVDTQHMYSKEAERANYAIDDFKLKKNVSMVYTNIIQRKNLIVKHALYSIKSNIQYLLKLLK